MDRAPKLNTGHWITLGGLAVQAVAIMAVVVWRVGAVERRIEALDARLWELARSRAAAVLFLPPADATAVHVATKEEKIP